MRVITRLNVGGPALQALILTERLDPTRFQTLLVTGRSGAHEGSMPELRGWRGMSPVVVPALQREISPADTIALARLIGLMRRYRPHIVHSHLAKAGLLARLAARLTGVPIVIHTFHGNVLHEYFDPARSSIFLGLERLLARLSTRIVVISRRQAEEIGRLRIAQEPRLVEVPLGVDLMPFLEPPRGLLRRELGIPSQIPLVGFVGRLVPIKAVDHFIEAVAILARERPIRAVIVGDGELRESAETLARKLAAPEVIRFLGWRADLPAIYGDLDVLVLTSLNEGTPVSILEAFAAGRPVVATGVGGVPDLIGAGDRGIVVPPRDPAAVARGVGRLLDSPGLGRRFADASRSFVYPAYDAATLVSRIEALYSDLALDRLVRQHRRTVR